VRGDGVEHRSNLTGPTETSVNRDGRGKRRKEVTRWGEQSPFQKLSGEQGLVIEKLRKKVSPRFLHEEGGG